MCHLISDIPTNFLGVLTRVLNGFVCYWVDVTTVFVVTAFYEPLKNNKTLNMFCRKGHVSVGDTHFISSPLAFEHLSSN